MSENRSAGTPLGLLLAALVAVGGGTIVVAYVVLGPQSTPDTTRAAGPGGPVLAPSGPGAGPSPRPRPSGAEPTSPFGSRPTTQPAPSTAIRQPPDTRRVRLELPDLQRVDPQQLFAPAERLARELEPQVQLSYGFPVTTHGELTGGTIDLTGQSRVHFDYQYRRTTPGEPPGKDVAQGSIVVIAAQGHLSASREVHEVHLPQGHEAIPAPTCPAVRAWQTALRSGVPVHAAAQLMYYDENPSQPGGPYVWSFRIAGHEAYRREIDGMTCALVKSWAKGR